MNAWHEFYAVIAGAAATLLGLVFVSVSLNAEAILGAGNKHSKRLAEQAFQNYLGAFVIALMALIPDITDRDFGFSLLCLSLAWSVWVLVRAFQSAAAHPGGYSRLASLRRYLAPVAAFGLLAYAGHAMWTGNNDVHGSVAMGVMILLISATVVAWDLLIKIAEEKYAPDDD
jgi:hypothetical protein